MELQQIAAQAGVSLNSDGELETKCDKCGGPAAIIFDVVLLAYCKGTCGGMLDAPATLKAFLAQAGADKAKREQASKPKTQRPPAAGNGSPAPRPRPPEQADHDLLRRVPPHNTDAEMSVLGAIFLDNDIWSDPAYGDVSTTLKAEEFYHERHRLIYRAMEETRQRGEPIDAVTISYTLGLHNALEQIGGAQYIGEIVAFVPTALHIQHYSKIVKEASFKRTVASRAVDIAAHAYNGVTGEALAGEIERQLGQEALFGSATSQFTLIKKSPEVLDWNLMKARRVTRHRDWVVEGWLARKETSMWAGKVEGGKTTALRSLCLSVVRGEPFLDREVTQGRVFYVMLDADGEDGTFDEFELMGFNDEDAKHMQFMFEPNLASMPRAMDQLAEKIRAFEPALVVIDPFARVEKVVDFKGYEATYLMAKLSELAKQTNAHYPLISHIPRGRGDDEDVATAAFGSIAFSGGVNARFVISKRGKGEVRTIRSSKGKGGSFKSLDNEYILQMDEETHRVSLGKLYDWKAQAIFSKPRVLEWLDNNPERTWNGAALGRELKLSESVCRAAGNDLFAEQKIKRPEGTGKKSKPWEFASLNYRDAD